MKNGLSAEEMALSVEKVAGALERLQQGRTSSEGVLWVDDNPQNNAQLVEAIRAARGYVIRLPRSA